MNCVRALSWWPTWPARPALLSPQKKLGIDSIFGPVWRGICRCCCCRCCWWLAHLILAHNYAVCIVPRTMDTKDMFALIIRLGHCTYKLILSCFKCSPAAAHQQHQQHTYTHTVKTHWMLSPVPIKRFFSHSQNKRQRRRRRRASKLAKLPAMDNNGWPEAGRQPGQERLAGRRAQAGKRFAAILMKQSHRQWVVWVVFALWLRPSVF